MLSLFFSESAHIEYLGTVPKLPKDGKWFWNLVERVMTILNWISNKQGLILNYSVISQKTISSQTETFKSYEDFAIVIQGPISEPRFLLNSIDFYSANFRDVKIYLSTWSNERNLKYFDSKSMISLIQNEQPKDSGISNLNLQVTSTLAGLKRAMYDGCSYALKIRTDQGLFSSRLLDQLLFSLINAPKSDYARIVTTDFNSFLFRRNSPSDQIQFASIKTLTCFWSGYKMDAQQNGGFAEEILLLGYLKSIGLNAPRSLEDSLKIYRDHYVFLDASDLGLVWRKGSWRHPDSRFEQLGRSSQLRFVSPDEWRRLHTDLKSVVAEAREIGTLND